jgi:hypothetical protein
MQHGDDHDPGGGLDHHDTQLYVTWGGGRGPGAEDLQEDPSAGDLQPGAHGPDRPRQ